MIRSFASRETERLFVGYRVRRFQSIERAAQRKLKMLHDAATLDFLTAVRGNRLEALRGDRQGQHSIRINDQWRICFVWANGDVYDVEIVDYH
jgi:proteic killer suppression protein